MRKWLLIIFLFSSTYLGAQTLGNMITISQTVPANLTVCGDAKQFTVTIYNPSPFLITQDSLFITLPTGVLYQFGSLNSSTPGVTFLNAFSGIVTVQLPDIQTLETITITFNASAQCNVIAFINGGGVIRDIARINYKANNNTRRYDTNNSLTYLIKQPNITITSVTNQSYVGNIGDVFTRCINIVNGGFGELTTFKLTDVHASGIQINSVNKGSFTQAGLTGTVVLNGSDFMTIGDGDSLFESGEMISICENVTVLNCISAGSSFKAFWGCSVNYCQATVSTANVVFPNYVPNLVVTPVTSMNTCFGAGNASQQQLRIVNTGLGQAVNVALDVFLSTGAGYNPNLGSYFDMTSFTLQTGLSGAPTPVVPTAILATTALPCAVGTKGKATITIPTINHGDTLYLKWNSYSCCYDACNSPSNQRVVNGWKYKGTYTNLCQTNYVLYEAWGRGYSDIYGFLTPDGSPSTLSNGQTGTFNFLFSNYGNSYPVGPGAYWKFEFTIPPFSCLTYSNIKIVRFDGTTIWSPTSVTASGNVVTAIFNGTPPFNLTQAELRIDLRVVCSSCSGTEQGTAISVKSYYVPDNTCACLIGVSCQSINFNINCPKPCAAGIMFNDFNVNRTSYGKPDNEVGGGNGIPDGSGSLNFSKIKTSRFMFGDTLTSTFAGTVNTNISHPTLQYCYATSSVSNGNLLGFLDDTLKIYRTGSLLYTCTNIVPTISTSGTTRNFVYDLSVPTLQASACAPGVPGGYLNTQDDSMSFICHYKNVVNVGNQVPLNCYFSNKFYLSELPNPTIDSTKLQCGTINGNSTAIGYWFQSWGGDAYSTKSCDNTVVTQNYYLSIGPGNNNDAGGNLFPNEYRNWSHIKTLTAVVPNGYTYVSARFMDVRTAGTLATANAGWINITPVDSTSDSLVFNVEPYFQTFGGSLVLDDDGFYGTLEVTIQPSCEVASGIQQNIKHDWTFGTSGFLTGPGSDTAFVSRTEDKILYDAPALFVQSVLPSIMAVDSIEYWDVLVSNTSNVADAANTWLSGPTISGVSVIQVIDLGTNLPITPIGNIYPIGTVAAMATRTFRVKAVYTSCDMDSVVMYCGWNCHDGYPTNVSSYPCVYQKITLSLTPLMPALFVDAFAPDTAIQLCDTATFLVNATNASLGTAYHLVLTATLPVGAQLVPGTSKFSYPDSTSFVSISDPVFVSGNTWKWNISAVNSLIGTDGFKGVLDSVLNSFKLKFGVTTQCGYTSGSGVTFTLIGMAACGDTTDSHVFPSSALNLIGVSEPYSTSIKIVTTYVSPCATNSLIKLVVFNHGPTDFGNTDSVSFKLPNGVSFVPGTFIGLHNPPFVGTPVQTLINGENYLIWRLPPGVTAGDSTVFSFEFAGEPVLLSCGIVYFEAQTRSSSTIVCSLTGANCITNIITGDTTLAVFIYKAYLDFNNGIATSVPNPPGGETVTLTYDIINTGQAILVADSVIQYYFDADGDGLYSVGDVYLHQDIVIVPKDSTITYTTTFNAPAGKACSIIGLVQPGVNNCACEPAQFIVQPQLISLGNDTTLCSGQTMLMSTPPVTGYTYSWSPGTDLSGVTASDALLTASNLTATPVSTTYTLATTRMGCGGNDTIVITVNPLPISNAGSDIVSCPTVVPGNLGVASLPGYTYSWSPVFGVSDTILSNPTVSLDSVRSTNYIVTTTALGCFSTDTVNVLVNPFPVANAGADIIVCSANALDTIGTTPLSGYTYHWTPSLDLNNDTLSNPTVATLTPRTTDYIVTAFAFGCSRNDTVTVKVNPLPTATVHGSIQVCQNATPPIVAFVGAIGTSPYTFTYHVNGDTNQTVMSIAGDSAFVSAPTNDTGTFTYYLTGVQDSSSTACYQAQSDSIKVRVNPLPVATIALGGDSAICQGGPYQPVILKASGTVAPYTFTYVLDNDTIQIVSGAGDSAVVMVPTDSGHLYTYYLIKVQDSGVATCFLLQNDSVSVRVNPLPIAVIRGATAVCRDANSPIVYFIGTTGTPPFTFTYTINNGAPQTVVSTSGDTAFLPASTVVDGSFIFHLIGASDASSTACSQPQNDSILITVDPLPTATISGTADVCQYSVQPSVTFVGHGGVTPYTFNYDLNGVPQPTLITALGDSSITIATPTDTVGVYTYSLISVKDSNTAVCTHPQTGNAVITVKPKPIANFSTTKVCSGNATQFSDSSTTLGTISSWNWYFGNGDSLINAQVPFYVYPSAGKYNVTLIVNNNYSCTDTISDTVSVYYNPVANFEHGDVCLGSTVLFTDSSFVDATVFTYDSIKSTIWLFGDGSPTVNNVKDTSHYYSTFGTYNVTLIVTSANNCTDVVNIPVKVYDFPTSSSLFSNTCLFDSALFVNTATRATMDSIGSWLWDFGDGSAVDSFNLSPHHLYSAPGNYEFTFITRNSILGCADTLKDTITVYPMPVANFASAPVCLLDTTYFYDSSSVITGTISGWSWNFDDSTLANTTQNPPHYFASATNYDVRLICTTDKGCKDTVIHNVVVHPLPTVDYGTVNVCDGDSVHFYDLSSIPTTDTLASWLWNYGDASQLGMGTTVAHLYDTAQGYNVQLTVTSTFGCIDSLTKLSVVNPNPVVAFTSIVTAGCEPFCIILMDSSKIASGHNVSWLWDFGDSTSTSILSMPEHCYFNDSIYDSVMYSTTLKVTSDSGCISVLTKTNYITVYPKPSAFFIAQPTSASIINPVISITDLSTGVNFWNWNFGDNSSSLLAVPISHTYADTGTYTIILTTTTQYGCMDTSSQSITIEPDFVFYVPNSFTPNDDGLNDTFSGKGIYIQTYQMMIFDRWGNLIFFTDDYTRPWDGRANHGAQLAQRDVYVYDIKVTDFKGIEHAYRGTVTLIR